MTERERRMHDEAVAEPEVPADHSAAESAAQEPVPEGSVPEGSVPEGSVPEASAPEGQERSGEAAPEERDLLDDLQRVQADFANYKKRMLREQTDIASRASRSLIERLLPVLDNFELAIAHGETGGGVDLVFKDLMAVLQAEGLESLESDGAPFDPKVHEAVEIHDDESVDEQTVTKTYRRGYALKGRLIRPAMVVVARPTQNAEAVGE